MYFIIITHFTYKHTYHINTSKDATISITHNHITDFIWLHLDAKTHFIKILKYIYLIFITHYNILNSHFMVFYRINTKFK
jgi:hypothetical protein